MSSEGLPESAREKIASLEAFDLKYFIPEFAPFPDEVVVLGLAPKKEWPEAGQMTCTDPRVAHIYFGGYTGMFPLIEFSSFVRGVAVASLVVKAGDRVNVTVLLEKLVQAMLEIGGEMPPRPALPDHLEEPCLEAVSEVVNSTEPHNWRRMLSFVYGSFWMLGFAVPSDPGKHGREAVGRVKECCLHYARLGVLPT